MPTTPTRFTFCRTGLCKVIYAESLTQAKRIARREMCRPGSKGTWKPKTNGGVLGDGETIYDWAPK